MIAFLLIVLGGVFVYFIIRAIIDGIRNAQAIEEPEAVAKPPRAKLTPTRINFDPERCAYMALESTHIIVTGKNIQTVYSRLLLLHDLLVNAEKVVEINPALWERTVNEQAEFYRIAYYDRHEEETINLYNPSLILDHWDEFRDNALFNAVYRYAMVQEKFINEVKLKSAKLKRMEKVLEEVAKLQGFIKNPQMCIKLVELREKLEEKISAL